MFFAISPIPSYAHSQLLFLYFDVPIKPTRNASSKPKSEMNIDQLLSQKESRTQQEQWWSITKHEDPHFFTLKFIKRIRRNLKFDFGILKFTWADILEPTHMLPSYSSLIPSCIYKFQNMVVSLTASTQGPPSLMSSRSRSRQTMAV